MVNIEEQLKACSPAYRNVLLAMQVIGYKQAREMVLKRSKISDPWFQNQVEISFEPQALGINCMYHVHGQKYRRTFLRGYCLEDGLTHQLIQALKKV